MRERQESDHRRKLEDMASRAQNLGEFRTHPGWQIFERIMTDYREQSYRAFLEERTTGEDYRAECRVLDFIGQCMDAVVEQGEDAAAELLKRGWK